MKLTARQRIEGKESMRQVTKIGMAVLLAATLHVGAMPTTAYAAEEPEPAAMAEVTGGG